jgi:MFS family permease
LSRSRYSDVFAPHFDFFGYHITDSTQTAMAVLLSVNQIIQTVTSCPGGMLDARYFGSLTKRKRILLLSQVVALPLGIIYLYRIDFTVVILLNVYGGVIGGLLAPTNIAFQADCLPAGPDGLPKDPTRDTLIYGWSGTLTGIVIPLIGGMVFNMGWSRRQT